MNSLVRKVTLASQTRLISNVIARYCFFLNPDHVPDKWLHDIFFQTDELVLQLVVLLSSALLVTA